MKLVYKMRHTDPIDEVPDIEPVPFSAAYMEKYKIMYNACYHEMREALDIKPYDYIQDDSFFETGMDHVYLLLDKDELIGSVAIKGDEIDDLIVVPKYQGRGYGRRLLIWALARLNGAAVLHVAEWNKRAVSLYEKTGFEIIETIEI